MAAVATAAVTFAVATWPPCATPSLHPLPEGPDRSAPAVPSAPAPHAGAVDDALAPLARPSGETPESRLQVAGFGARITSPGQCSLTDAAALAAHRELVLARFVGTGPTVRHDPAVPPARALLIDQVAGQAANDVAQFMQQRVIMPRIFAYRDRGQMQSIACVNVLRQDYYDGAVHLVANAVADDTAQAALREAIVHALVHHALLARGVLGPAWVHEGLAMFVAGEVWWMQPERGLRTWAETSHLPFAAMTTASPHSDPPDESLKSFYQSITMLQAVNHTCGEARIPALVDALATGAVTADAAFAWALSRGREGQEEAWRRAVANQAVMGGYFRNMRLPVPTPTRTPLHIAP